MNKVPLWKEEYKALEWEQKSSPKYTQVYITKCVSVKCFSIFFFQVMEMLFIGFKTETVNRPYEESSKTALVNRPYEKSSKLKQ